MLDAYLRPLIDMPLHKVAKILVKFKITANMVTLVGFLLGISAMFLVAYNHYYAGLLLICLNRISDGLDGAVARHSASSNFGGFLDIVVDFIFYSGIIFAFGISKPESIFFFSFLMFSFVGPMSSFLAYAIIAEKLKRESTKNGMKSFYHSVGLCEGSETFLLLILLCILPEYHNSLCIIFGLLCWITTIQRILFAKQDF